MGNALLTQRFVGDALAALMDYLGNDFFFSGGYVFWLVERLYLRYFDGSIRQRLPGASKKHQVETLSELPDHENPRVVGIKRRPAHAFLRAFTSTDECLSYWSDIEKRSDRALKNILYLTGDAGTPDNDNPWDFLFVGSPDASPAHWETASYDTAAIGSGKWAAVALPGHWQLQGFDIPIYTNTAYPFQFDPPRVRRNGHWTMTACDLGLGANPENSGELDPREPGENATGLYRRKFTVPNDWKHENSRLFLVFEGVDSCVRAWVNGVFVGYSQDSCLPAEFDITDAILSDSSLNEHVLAVQVLRFCDGSYIEDQDMWWLSGIYREVYILRKPKRFICDYEFTSDITVYVEKPNIDKKTGLEKKKTYDNKPVGPPSAGITVNVLVEGVIAERTQREGKEKGNGDGVGFAVRAEMWASYPTPPAAGAGSAPAVVVTGLLHSSKNIPNRGLADELVESTEGDVDPLSFQDSGLATLHGSIENPLIWTAETPQLYTLVISLYGSLEDAEKGVDPIDVESCRVGIRDVRIMDEDNLLCVNGRPITIAGVNRHEFDPRLGRAVNDEVMREDARIMKSLNFNAVRLSHYPQHHRWLDICDEAGLYVVDEANIESHGFQIVGQPVGYLSHLPEWRGALLSRVTRMYERDKNSTSIIIWSLGNESGSGPTHEDMFLWLHTRDPRRIVQYESGGARSNVTDIICPMYKRPWWCVKQALEDPKKRPVILCEYAHAMGNSGGGLDVYWRLFQNDRVPRFQGGFIWDFKDQGLLMPDGGFGYGGDFGDRPNTKNFNCNGIIGPDSKPHPSAYEAAALQAPVQFRIVPTSKGEPFLAVINRRCHLDLSDNLVVSISLNCDVLPKGYIVPPVVLNLGKMGKKKIEPGEHVLFPLAMVWPSVDSDLDAPPPPPPQRSEEVRKEEELRNWNKSERSISRTGSNRSIRGSSSTSSDNLLTTGGGRVRGGVSSSSSDGNDTPRERGGRGGGGGENSEGGKTGGNIDDLVESLGGGVPVERLASMTEAWFDITVTTTQDSKWLPAGHVVAHKSLADEQLTTKFAALLPPRPHLVTNTSEFTTVVSVAEVNFGDDDDDTASKATTSSDDGVADRERDADEPHLRVSWSTGAWATIGRRCGRITRWYDAHGRAMISAPLDVCFWRAPTDNDRGGAFISYAARWKAVGLDAMSREVQRTAIASCEALFDGSIVVKATWTLVPPTNASGGCRIPCSATYTLLPSGAIRIDSSFYPPSSLPPIPRAGIRFAVPAEFDQAEWLGLGPHEAYEDRKTAVYMGSFESSVAELHTPYVVPQENGRRADPRWFSLRGKSESWSSSASAAAAATASASLPASLGCKGAGSKESSGGLMVIPHPDVASRDVTGWGWSASVYSLEALEAADHDHELRQDADGKVHVHVDSQTMGVGGYDSWSPNVEKGKLVESGEKMNTSVLLVPLVQADAGADVYVDFLQGKYDVSY